MHLVLSLPCPSFLNLPNAVKTLHREGATPLFLTLTDIRYTKLNFLYDLMMR